MARTALAPCTCSAFQFGDDETTTGCRQSTHRTFAMGHDAKLVGFLVRAEMEGIEISRVVDGMKQTYQNAVHAAGTISDKLAIKAQHQLEAAHRRAIKKASAANKKASKADTAPAPVVPTHIDATIKVGRWAYPATIELATGEATYQGKLTGTKTVAKGKYSIAN